MPVGAFIVQILNALIFTGPFIIFHVTESKFNRAIGLLNFVLTWLALEYLQLNWELAYPFLNLGNGLAMYPQIFQWYEYTGSLGGSLWILLINILISEFVFLLRSKKSSSIRLSASLVLIVIAPVAFSLYKFKTFREYGKTVSVAIINPAIDCYNEKYTTDMNWLLDKYLAQSKEFKDPDFILWPETAIPDAGLSDELNSNPYLEKIRDGLFDKHVSLLVTGAIIYKKHGDNPKDKLGKIYYPPLNEYLSTHNSAIEIKRSTPIRIVRSKKILVPFEETIPYPYLLSWVRQATGTLGGFTFSRLSEGIGYVENNEVKATPLICYEILFGDEVSLLSLQNNMFFLLLNEGWYKSETGASQFLYYSCLRAVETRRSIARSSNMGISAMINQRGEIIKRTGNINEPGIIEGSLSTGHTNTFYSMIGDLLGEIAEFGLIFLNILGLAILLFRKSKTGRLFENK